MFFAQVQCLSEKNHEEPSTTSMEEMSGICMLLSLWITVLNQINQCVEQSSSEKCPLLPLSWTRSLCYNEYTLSQYEQHVVKALCLILQNKFDVEKLRHFMLFSDNYYDGWKPPSFYWQLMSTSDTANTLKQLCGNERRSEFLHCFLEDLLTLKTSTNRNWKLSSDREFSRITSSFTIYHRTLTEVICEFLLKDDNEDLGMEETHRFCELLCHTENSYLYSQAMLHFLPRWRPDFMGCRKLSQALYEYVRNILCNCRVANIALFLMEFECFPKLRCTLNNVFCQGGFILNTALTLDLFPYVFSDFNKALPQDLICSLSDVVHNTLNCFHQYQTLLYPKPSNKKRSFHRYLDTANLTDNFKTPCLGSSLEHRTQCLTQRYQNQSELDQMGLSVDSCDTRHLSDNSATSLVSSHVLLDDDRIDQHFFMNKENDSDALCSPPNPQRNFLQQASLICSSLTSFYIIQSQNTLLDECSDSPELHSTAGASSDGTLVEELLSSYSATSTKKKSPFWNNQTCYDTYQSPGLNLKKRNYISESMSLDLPPASQSGKIWKEEYNRLRYSVEHCPLFTVRSELFLDTLFYNFVCFMENLSPVVLNKMIDLLLNLTTLNTYEILAYQNDYFEILSAKYPKYRRHRRHFHESERPLPGHWTTEGAYNLEEEGFAERDDDERDDEDKDLESVYTQAQPTHKNLDQAFTSVDSSYNITPTVRIGLGSAKIGLSYSEHIHPVVYSSFMDGKQQDELQNGHLLTSSPGGPSKETSGGSWLDSVWQNGTSVVQRDSLNKLRTCSSGHPTSPKDEVWEICQPKDISTHGTLHQDTCSLYNLMDSDKPSTPHSSSDSPTFSSPSAIIKHHDKQPTKSQRLCTSLFESSPSSSTWPTTSDCTSIERALLGTPSSTETLSNLNPSACDYSSSKHLESFLDAPWVEEQKASSQSSPPYRKPIKQPKFTELRRSPLNSFWEKQSSQASYYPSPIRTKSFTSRPSPLSSLSSYSSNDDDADDNHNDEIQTKPSLYSEPLDSDIAPFINPAKRQKRYVLSPLTKVSVPSTNTSFLSRVQSASYFISHAKGPFDKYDPEPYPFGSQISHAHRSPSRSTLEEKTLKMKSTIDSDIYVDPGGNYTLGPSSIGYTHASCSRDRFRELDRRVNAYKDIARRDLLNAYTILGYPVSVSSEARAALLFRCTNSLVGASVFLCFLKRRILFLDREDVDPLLNVSPVVLILFMALCQRHPKKKPCVVELLHQCFNKSRVLNGTSTQRRTFPQSCNHDGADPNSDLVKSTSNVDNSKLLQRHRQIFDFLLWLLGTGFYSGVFSFLRVHMAHVDSCLLRKQLEYILNSCKAPFSPSFLASLIHLLHQVICVQNSLDLVSDANCAVRTNVLQFLIHAQTCWSPSQLPRTVFHRLSDLQRTLSRTRKN